MDIIWFLILSWTPAKIIAIVLYIGFVAFGSRLLYRITVPPLPRRPRIRRSWALLCLAAVDLICGGYLVLPTGTLWGSIPVGCLVVGLIITAE